MKKLLFFLLLTCCGVLAAADPEEDYLRPDPTTDYRNPENWVICEADKPDTDTDFDVFYVYPTLFADKKQPLAIDLRTVVGVPDARYLRFSGEGLAPCRDGKNWVFRFSNIRVDFTAR